MKKITAVGIAALATKILTILMLVGCLLFLNHNDKLDLETFFKAIPLILILMISIAALLSPKVPYLASAFRSKSFQWLMGVLIFLMMAALIAPEI